MRMQINLAKPQALWTGNVEYTRHDGTVGWAGLGLLQERHIAVREATKLVDYYTTDAQTGYPLAIFRIERVCGACRGSGEQKPARIYRRRLIKAIPCPWCENGLADF